MFAKRIVFFLLALCLLFSLAACGAPAPEAPAPKPGRWVEEKINLPIPENARDFRLFSHEGILEAVFYDTDTSFFDRNLIFPINVVGWLRSKDLGKTWKSVDISFLGEPLQNYDHPFCDLRIGDGGEVWFLLAEADNDAFSNIFIAPPILPQEEKRALISPRFYHLQNGQTVEAALPFAPFDDVFTRSTKEAGQLCPFFPLKDGSCLFSHLDGTFTQVDSGGARLSNFELSLEGLTYVPYQGLRQIHGDWMLTSNIMLPDDSRVIRYNLADGSTDNFSFSNGTVCTVDSEGFLYALSHEKLSRISAGGGLEEELISGKDGYFFSGVKNTFTSLVSCQGSLFTVANRSMLLRYYYDPEALPPSEKNITVFSMHDEPLVRQTIAQLRLTNPGLSVTYRVGDTEMDGAITEQDYIKMLNTELLAATGPDVVILDGLGNAASYLASGVFVDLNGLIDFSGLFPNLLAAGQYEGGQYAVPAGVIFPAILDYYGDVLRRSDPLPADEAVLKTGEPMPVFNTLSQLLEQSQAQAGRQVYQQMAHGKKQICWLSPYYNDSFEALYLAALPEFSSPDASTYVPRFLEAVSWMKYNNPYGEQVDGSGPPAFSLLRATPLSYDPDDTFSLAIKLQALPSFDGKKAFLPYGMAAIPQKKTVSEDALAFIDAMLCEEVQTQNYSLTTYSDAYFSCLTSGNYVPVRKSCLQTSRSHISDTVSQLDAPVFFDAERAQTFLEVSCEYIKGNIDADEAAAQIMDSFSREETLYALETGGG